MDRRLNDVSGGSSSTMMSVTRQRSAIAISVLVHAIVVVLVLTREPAEERRDDSEPVSIELIDVSPAPETVAVIEPKPEPEPEPAKPAAATPPPPIVRRPPPARTAPPAAHETSTSTGTRGAETAPGPAEPDPGAGSGSSRSPYFAMRRGRGVDLSVPSTYDALDRVPRGTNADFGPPASGQLKPSGGGTHRANKGEFAATVRADGSVSLGDKSSFSAGLRNPFKRNAEDSDGIISPIAGKMEVSDAIMRAAGIDPYAAKKLKFLDETRDERVAIGQRYRADQLRRTSEIIQRHLDRVARMPDPRARRAALFELWDEAIETGDAAHVEAGRAARVRVIGVIRARYAAGTPDEYTPEELAAFNSRRTSKAPFAPYGDGD